MLWGYWTVSKLPSTLWEASSQLGVSHCVQQRINVDIAVATSNVLFYVYRRVSFSLGDERSYVVRFWGTKHHSVRSLVEACDRVTTWLAEVVFLFGELIGESLAR